jgi:hypothetical protein
MTARFFATAVTAMMIFATSPALPQVGQTAPVKRMAPTPTRMADGKPNWTGFWATPGGMLEVYRGPNFGAGRGGPAINVPGGRQRREGLPEMKSPYKEQYDAYLKETPGPATRDAGALCSPVGMPAMMGMIYGMEILQTPKIVAITSEFGPRTRRIWMNEKLPALDDLDPTYSGYSVGRWEGNALVVETIAIRVEQLLGGNVPHSPNLKITERIFEKEPGLLVDEMTIDDPDAFVASWKETTRTYAYRGDFKLQEFWCSENNRGVDGSTGLPKFQ